MVDTWWKSAVGGLCCCNFSPVATAYICKTALLASFHCTSGATGITTESIMIGLLTSYLKTSAKDFNRCFCEHNVQTDIIIEQLTATSPDSLTNCVILGVVAWGGTQQTLWFVNHSYLPYKGVELFELFLFQEYSKHQPSRWERPDSLVVGCIRTNFINFIKSC